MILLTKTTIKHLWKGQVLNQKKNIQELPRHIILNLKILRSCVNNLINTKDTNL